MSARQAATLVQRDYEVSPPGTEEAHIRNAEAIAKLPSAAPPNLQDMNKKPGQQSAIDPGMRFAMRSPAANSVTNNSPVSNTSSAETHIGQVVVNTTGPQDSDGIAKGIGQSLQRYAYVPQANYGLA